MKFLGERFKVSINPASVLIGGIFVLVVIIGVLLFPKTPKNTKTGTPLDSGKIVNVKGNIIAEVTGDSEISGYQVTITNRPLLINLLNQWHLYGSRFVEKGKETEAKPVNLVRFILTDKVQPYYLIGNTKKELVASSNFKLTGSEIHVLVYVAKDELVNANKYFEQEVLETLYMFINPLQPKETEQQRVDRFNAFLKDKNSRHEKFFEIVKK